MNAICSGEIVMTIRATDKDEGANGNVKFKFQPNSIEPNTFPDSQFYPYFEIDDKGTIRTRATFDREREDMYSGQVVAYDTGTPNSLSSMYSSNTLTLDSLYSWSSIAFLFLRF